MREQPEHSQKKETEKRRKPSTDVEGNSLSNDSVDFDVPHFDTPDPLAATNLLQLQRTRGNAYVRRMVADLRSGKAGAPLSSESVLSLQRTHGNAYVRRMLGRVQREVNQATIEKIEGYANDVPDTPTNYPGVFTELNPLSIPDMRDTLIQLDRRGVMDRILDHMGDAKGVNIGNIRSGFMSAIFSGADPAKPSDQAQDRLAKLLGTTRDKLGKAVSALPDNQRTFIIGFLPALAHGEVRTEFEEHVGGVKYVGDVAYDWELSATKIRIVVKIKFTGLQNPTVFQAWMDRIKEQWNIFKAVNTANAAQSLLIEFDPQVVGSSQHHKVEVKPGASRSDESTFYIGDPPGNDKALKMAVHEFGHMIGLKDEYQLTHDAYKETVGAEPDAGVTRGDAPATQIAMEMHEALHYGFAKWTAGQERHDKALAVITNHHLKQGQFAQSVAAVYKDIYSVEIVDDIVSYLREADQFWVVDPFTFSSDSPMGAGNNDDEHTHPVLPRHVATFAQIVQKERGGTWEPQNR